MYYFYTNDCRDKHEFEDINEAFEASAGNHLVFEQINGFPPRVVMGTMALDENIIVMRTDEKKNLIQLGHMGTIYIVNIIQLGVMSSECAIYRYSEENFHNVNLTDAHEDIIYFVARLICNRQMELRNAPCIEN